ncbi:MAG: hypothetical protein GY913_20215 [Proteobacteria bacterium]|nr:hypothetical protein [Pseudomonadota bacterium]MCP4919232.1 hypothetical protein [Pseudomonadota bacterium]
MADLHVTVRFNDFIVEDRVLAVSDVLRIGEADDSVVHFPGASVAVCRVGETLDIRGRRLAEGERTGFSLGQVHVELEHLVPLEVRRTNPPAIDARFLLVAMAVTTAGMWFDALHSVVDAPPPGPVASWVDDAREVVPFLDVAAEDMARRAAVQPNYEVAYLPQVVIRGEGREATNDDAVTGYGYYPWYRVEVPSTLQAELARLRLGDDPADWSQHALIARGAYDNDNWRDALVHYQELLDQEPSDVRWLYGVAQSQKRLGLHRMELETYARLLEVDDQHVHALGNGAVAFAKMGDYETAELWLDRMRTSEQSDDPYLDVYEGMVAAVVGLEGDAIEHLEAACSRREAMTDSQRVELRRDLAMDPALSQLRTNRALRSMLWRHYGAASPRKRR